MSPRRAADATSRRSRRGRPRRSRLTRLQTVAAVVLTALLAGPPAAHAEPAPATRTVHAAGAVPATVSLDGDRWRMKDYAVGDGLAAGAARTDLDDSGWYAATVPSTANGVLADAGITPDPLGYGTSGWDWVGNREWWYRIRFDVAEQWRDSLVRLHVKGAMDRAEVYLNGQLIGSTDGMYDEAWLDAGEHLRAGATNTLAIRTWPDPRGQQQRISIHANTGYWRGFQYQKNVRTVGLWRGVDLVATAPSAYLAETFVRTVGDLTADATAAVLRVTQAVVNPTDQPQPVRLGWRLGGDTFAMAPLTGHRDATVAPGRHTIDYDVPVTGDRLHLWWPNGYGEALPDGSRYLYALDSELTAAGSVLDRARTDAIGIRSLSYRPTTGAAPDDYPLTYVVNGEPIYLQGGNWVPSDALYRADRMSRNYQRTLRLAFEGHVRMLRLWGGGIEENPEFYRLASRYGILLLQEFWHFYTNYVVDEPLWRANADDVVTRLRNYPALAAWGGGNELTGTTEGDRDKAEAYPFVKLVRESYDRLDGTRQFFGTSPAGGMCHRWTGIHLVGSEGYEKTHGAPCDFLTEVGMAAAPAAATLATYEGARADRVYRAMGTEYLNYNEFGAYLDNTDLANKTQLAQAIGMSYNLGWAKAQKWSSGGALAWEYNDMAPMVGWGIVDYEGAPKVSYYQLKRTWAEVAVRAQYDRYWFDPGESFTASVDILNDRRRKLTNHRLTTTLTTLDGEVLSRRTQRVDVPRNADGGVLRLPAQDFTPPAERGVFLLVLDVTEPAGRRIARDTTLFTTEPNRSLYTLAAHADPSRLALRERAHAGAREVTVTNTGTTVAYGVDLVTRPGEYASDDYFTLLPGESTTVRVTTFAGSPATGPIDVSQIGAAEASPNLALGKPAYGSAGDYVFATGAGTFSQRRALYATDGDRAYTPSTNYSTWIAGTASATLTVDLVHRQRIAQVDLLWGAGHGTAYEVQVSDDAATWRTVATVTAGDGGRDTHRFTPTDARYVRLAGTASSGSYDVRELEVYGAPTEPPAGRTVPGAVEVELLPDAVVGGGERRTVTGDATLGNGGADQLVPSGPGASIGYDLAVQARPYSVRVGLRAQPDGAKAQLRIGGTAFGAVVDSHDDSTRPIEVDLGVRTFQNPTTARFSWHLTGPGNLTVDYIRLVPKDFVAEVENLTTTVSPGARYSVFPDSRTSGGAGGKLEPPGAGGWVSYLVPVPEPGTYTIDVGYKAQDTRGVMQVHVDGEPLGEPVDTYAPSDTYPRTTLGQRALAGGHVEVRFEVVGRNPRSLGYTLGLDYIRLTRTD